MTGFQESRTDATSTIQAEQRGSVPRWHKYREPGGPAKCSSWSNEVLQGLHFQTWQTQTLDVSSKLTVTRNEAYLSRLQSSNLIQMATHGRSQGDLLTVFRSEAPTKSIKLWAVTPPYTDDILKISKEKERKIYKTEKHGVIQETKWKHTGIPLFDTFKICLLPISR